MKRKSNEYDAASAVATNESLIAMSASPSLSPRDVMSVATSIQSTSVYLDASEDERTNSPSDMSPFFDASAYDARRFSLSSADSLSSESPAVPSLPVQSMLAALADDSHGVPSPPKRGRGRPKRSVAPSASSSSSAAVPPLVLPPTEGSSFQLPSPLPESSPIPSPKKGSIVEWNGCYFSMQALKVLQKMQDEARKRNSDEFGVFIYNEFSAYGCIEVIENEMLHVERWLLRKQKPCDAFRTLEGITHFMQRDSSYSRIDDSKRVKMLVSTFSAAWIHTLKALTQCGSLTAQVLPNLVEVVFRAAQVVELHVGVAGRFTRADEHLRSFLDLLQSGVQDQFSLVFSLEARDHDAEEDERDGVQYLEDFEENFDFGDSLEFYRLQYGDNTRIIGGERFDLSLKPQNFLAPYRNGRARDVSGDEFINSMML